MKTFSPPPAGSIRAYMHDLNGQVFVVRGMAELLKMELASDPVALARVKKILTASEKMADIVTKVGARARENDL